jgi:hypothetical protein
MAQKQPSLPAKALYLLVAVLQLSALGIAAYVLIERGPLATTAAAP